MSPTKGPEVREIALVSFYQQIRWAAAVRDSTIYNTQVVTETLLKWANACWGHGD